MSLITGLRGLEILDSRGNPTVAAEVTLACGARGYAAAPSGASTGSREAIELRDGDAKRYGGKGVLRAVGHVNGELRASLLGQDADGQAALDERLIQLDGTPENRVWAPTLCWPHRWPWPGPQPPAMACRSTSTSVCKRASRCPCP